MSEEKNIRKNPTRLPSLKEPRDLTLGGIVKRKFMPTIPAPKSKKNLVLTEPEIKKIDFKPEYKNNEKINKKDYKNRHKSDLIQLKSIFDEGPKEENKLKRESNSRFFSDKESTSSAIKIESKSHLKKTEENREILDRLLQDNFILDNSSEDSDGEKCSKLKDKSKPISLPFKKESIDKKELPINKDDVVNIQKPILSFESLFKNEFILVEHPDIFPGYPPTDPTLLQNKNSEIKDENKSLGAFSEGCIGTLKYFKNGKISLCINNITLDVVQNLPSGMLQEVVKVDLKDGATNGEMIVLGHVNQKLTLIPNIDDMLDSIHVTN